MDEGRFIPIKRLNSVWRLRCRYDFFVLLCTSVYTPSQKNLGS
jgi:hypothetical protein